MTRSTQRQSSAQNNGPQRPSDATSVPSTSSAMLSAKEVESASDNDTGERPVREKLKKTSIATLPKYGVTAAGADEPVDDDYHMAAQTTGSKASSDVQLVDQDTRGRPTRKRSFDDLEATDELSAANKPTTNKDEKERHEGHTRKRSRDIRADNSSRESGRRKSSREEPVLEEEANDGDEDDKMKVSQERSSTPPGQLEIMDEDEGHGVLSPRKKRSREQVEQDEDKKQKVAATEEERARRNSEEEEKAAQARRQDTSQTAGKELEKKRHRGMSEGGGGQEQTDIPTKKVLPASGFSNTSDVSPFGTLASTKSDSNSPSGLPSDISVVEPQTSSSAFAASGFAALSKSTTSPFGTLGATSSTSGASPFSSLGSAAKTTALPSTTGPSNKASLDTKSIFGASAAPASGGFGSAAGSTFGTSTTSAFGALGGSRLGMGFGSGFGGMGAGGLKTFAAPNGPSVLGAGASSSRAFGSPAVDDEEEEDGDDDGQPSGEARYGEAQDREDKRFHEQDVETGEEGESTLFSCKAKLYHFTGKEWKERGIGTFKLNVTDDGDESKKTARLIMRTVGVFRVVLNTPVFKGMKIGDNAGKEPTGKMINLAGVENGKPIPLMLKVGAAEVAKELYRKTQEVQQQL